MKEAFSPASFGTLSTSRIKLMVDVKDSSESSGSTFHGPILRGAVGGGWKFWWKCSRCGSNLRWQTKEVRVRKVTCAWVARVAAIGVRLAPQRTSFCSYAPGEPPGRRQWESFPPAGTRGEVGNGVSEEPSGSPGGRICVEQAGEGRGVWRRSEKSTHQPQEVGLELKSDLRESKAVRTKFYLRYLCSHSSALRRGDAGPESSVIYSP